MDMTITPAQMKALETQYMLEYAVPSALLMEHAAQAVCAALARRTSGSRALFLCGSGNNGGDGYAAARLWQQRGKKAIVWEVTDALAGDAAMNRILAQQSGIFPQSIADKLPDCDIVVDALFGTGLSRPIEGTLAALIRLVNESTLPVIAVDIPSGLNGETGQVLSSAICADETVTFHRIKPGLLLRDGPRHAGSITVAPILIPAAYGMQEGLCCLTPDDIPVLLPPRPVDAHKGDFGRVVILAGSVGMAGAAAFCASAAVKTGAGLTTVLCRQAVLPIVQALVPGATCIPLPERSGRLTREAAPIAAEALARADSACIGCGLGQTDDLLPLLDVFRHAACPVVWDADALNLLARHSACLPLPNSAVLTPHPGEAARLLGSTAAAIAADPLTALHKLHAHYGGVVLLKGARTLMTDGTADAVNRFGSPAMAKGGSGDILAGMLAALLARKITGSTLETVQLGALLHGMAGMRAASLAGDDCVTPQMMIDCIRTQAPA